MKTLADLLTEEARKLEAQTGHICYLSYPYPCCLPEAVAHSRKYEAPPASRLEIVREAKQTTIRIKPPPKSRRRKWAEIKLWSS